MAEPRTGDPCPKDCGGHLWIHTSHTLGEFHVRYLRCADCKAVPENHIQMVKATEVRKRRRRAKTPAAPN
jgi:hypothetical protein